MKGIIRSWGMAGRDDGARGSEAKDMYAGSQKDA